MTAAKSDTPLTEQQRAAIETRTCSVALSAGAGCGKTFVLTRRFLSHLAPERDPVPLDRLVAITYTERAAREMRERIRKACHDRLKNCPAAEADYWLGIVRELESARISTIHSFCSSLLRRYSVEAGLDPRFELLEELPAELLRREAVIDTFRQQLPLADPDVDELVSVLQLQGAIDLVEQLVPQLYRTHQFPAELRSADALWTHWQTVLTRDVIPRAIDEFMNSPFLQRVWQVAMANRTGLKGAFPEKMQAICDLLDQLPGSNDQPGLLALLKTACTPHHTAIRKLWPDDLDYQEHLDLFRDVRAEIDRLRGMWSFQPEESLHAARLGLVVWRLAEIAGAKFDQAKRQQAGLDFDDLLLLTRNLLRDSREVRTECQQQIRLLMVDEFQDTDPIQADIVRFLCGKEIFQGKLFLVGDIKQSIYRFRRAEPRVFEQLRSEIPAEGRLPLSQNFRSQPDILRFVNALFDGALPGEYEPLIPFHTQQTAAPTIEFLWSSPASAANDSAGSEEPSDTGLSESGDDEAGGSASEDPQTTDDLRKQEADWIARRLHGLLHDGVARVRESVGPAAGQLRTVQPRDIVILLRAMSDVRHYEAALRRYDIDYYVVGGHAFFAQQEVFDLVQLCLSIQDPLDEVSLLGLLRSPFFCLADDTLYLLTAGGLPLGEALFAPVPASLDEEQAERVRYAARTLSDLRAMKDHATLVELLRLAIDRTAYDASLLGEFLGARKYANLQKVFELARQMDALGRASLSDLADHLQHSVLEESREALAATHPESSNVVRLMTIHQSKGLEFPVVVLADMNRKVQESRVHGVLDPELGPIIQLKSQLRQDPKSSVSLAVRLWKELDRPLQHAETLRLLYVALTRAADCLILSASSKTRLKFEHPWLELLHKRFNLATGEPQLALTAEATQTGIPLRSAEDLPAIQVTMAQPPLVAAVESKPEFNPRLQGFAQELAVAEAAPVPAMVLPFVPAGTGAWTCSVSTLEQWDEPLEREQSLSWIQRQPPSRFVLTAADNMAGEPVAAAHWPSLGGSDAEQLGHLIHAVLERFEPGSNLTTAARIQSAWNGLMSHSLPAPLAERSQVLLDRLFASDWWRQRSTSAVWLRETPFILDLEQIGRLSPLSGQSPSQLIATEQLAPRSSGGKPSRASEASRSRSNQRQLNYGIEDDAPTRQSSAGSPPSLPSSARSASHGGRISGTIDALFRTSSGGWLVVDYKTRTVASHPHAVEQLVHFELQLGIYCRAIHAWCGQFPERVELVLLGQQTQIVSFAPDAEFLASIAQRVQRVASRTIAEAVLTSAEP